MLLKLRLRWQRWKIGQRIKRYKVVRRQLHAKRRRIRELERETFTIKVATVGGVVLVWAYIEFFIDGWVQILHRAGGAELVQTDLPASLSREIDFLKRCWRVVQAPPELIAEGKRLIAEIQLMKDFRHNLVHGITDLNDADVIKVAVWKVEGQNRRELKLPYTTDKLIANVARVAELHSNLSAFFMALADSGVTLKEAHS